MLHPATKLNLEFESLLIFAAVHGDRSSKLLKLTTCLDGVSYRFFDTYVCVKQCRLIINKYT